ncbi:MAG TPA: site-2 protease family protein [Pseudonocardiaceae bacterium]
MIAVTALGGALACTDSSVAVTTGIVLLVLGGWAVSLCVHEFGHAYVALRGGDHSVRAKGYLTLDIRRYADPVLSLVLPLVLLLAGGFPLPGGAVWIEHHAIRSRAARAAVSLAGPSSNLVIGALLVVIAAAAPMPEGLRWGLACLALLQVLTFVLNMLPVPGLDGFGVIEPYLSYEARAFAAKVRPWAPLALFVLLISVPAVAGPLFDVSFAIFDSIGGDRPAAAEGFDRFLFWR